MDQSDKIMFPVKVEDLENSKMSIEILLNTFIRELMKYTFQYSNLASYLYLRFYTLFKSMLKSTGHRELKSILLQSGKYTRLGIVEKEMAYSDPSNNFPNMITIHNVTSDSHSVFLAELRKEIKPLSDDENIELVFSDLDLSPLVTECSICLKVDNKTNDHAWIYMRTYKKLNVQTHKKLNGVSSGVYVPIIDIRYYWSHNCVTITHNIINLYKQKEAYLAKYSVSFLNILYSMFHNVISNTILKESIKWDIVPSPSLMKSLVRDVSFFHNKDMVLDTNIEGITNNDNSVQLYFDFMNSDNLKGDQLIKRYVEPDYTTPEADNVF